MDKDYLKKYLGKAFKFKGSDKCPPLFVAEISEQITDKDIRNETSGFLKFSEGESIIRLKVKWFYSGGKNTGFGEAQFFEEELEEYDKEKIQYQFPDFDSFEEEFGLPISLPYSRRRGLSKNRFGKLEIEKCKMVVLDILRNKEQSKFGNPTIIRPEYLLKCKWYNESTGKFQETVLPKEFFIEPSIEEGEEEEE